MPVIQKLRKWHFLLLGGTLILISAFLWYWDWRHLGIPTPLRAEHCITILCFFIGIFVLGLFIFRLTRKQVTIMLVMMIVATLGAVLGTLWIHRTYPALFELLRHKAIEDYEPTYVVEWQQYFLNPALYAINISLILLWVESVVMYFIRKPSDQPE